MPTGSEPLSNKRQETFCLLYVAKGNATACYIEAGYAPKSAGREAHKTLKKPEIAERVQFLRKEALDKVEMTSDQIIARFVAIATADPNELMSLKSGACRYCHGKKHEYHWRTANEFNRTLAAYAALPDKQRALQLIPTEEGGYGYTRSADPHPHCPECDGEGMVYTSLRDTALASPHAQTLFAGVKETQHGIEIKTHDQMAALNNLARIRGLYAKEERTPEADALAAIINGICNTGSRIPIATQQPVVEDKGDG